MLDKKTVEILRSEQFINIRQDTLRVILQRNTLSAEEHDIYLAVERWAVEACKRNSMELSAVNRRQMLGDAIFLVHFPLLTVAQLSDGPATSGLLTEAELLSIFLHQNAASKPTLLFPTEQRRDVQLPMGFRLEDIVFAQGPCGSWDLAKIIGVRQSMLVVRWAADGREGSVETGNVVLATDIRINNASIMKIRGFFLYSRGFTLNV
ncbi:BTB/POZ domain-containing protein 2-like [Paramacrobiotus metropolitanus]|uniref:BTB/POZ domain-containing protein 2-like n=1 Tax=Paramacrobiotus metropolitanus TaxID=2943436 RepID=UPI002446102C|nr:BTB/POZ domain-containing protein 2-like [Paramacrobiotus metropolitanus]XP_055351479.1 BTB/POZ domain-containing protein 2-like [Paramacrobiotus metropolitanus]